MKKFSLSKQRLPLNRIRKLKLNRISKVNNKLNPIKKLQKFYMEQI